MEMCSIPGKPDSQILVYRFSLMDDLFVAEKKLMDVVIWGNVFSQKPRDVLCFGSEPFTAPRLCSSDIGISGVLNKGAMNELVVRVVSSQVAAVEEILGRPSHRKRVSPRVIFVP